MSQGAPKQSPSVRDKENDGGGAGIHGVDLNNLKQELFLKNFPKAIDERICRESPLLAKAIAAEHLLQVN